jgi:hypothetical protein
MKIQGLVLFKGECGFLHGTVPLKGLLKESYLENTGSTDHELRVFQVVGLDEEEAAQPKSTAVSTAMPGLGEEAKVNDNGRISHHYCLKVMGSVKRQAGGNERVSRLRFDETGTMLACLGTGKSVELFR